jgi:hypothetical protein
MAAPLELRGIVRVVVMVNELSPAANRGALISAVA